MLHAIAAALILGVSAGLQPGPLSALVLRESVSHGFQAGARVAFAPILSDGPIILVTLALLRPLRDSSTALAVLGVAGAVYCLWLAWKTWTLAEASERAGAQGTGTLRQAVIVNFLNPNPYIFWLSIGGAYITAATAAQAVGFIVAFMFAIVGTKIAMAWLFAQARARAPVSMPKWIFKGLAVVLAVFAAQLFMRAFESLVA